MSVSTLFAIENLQPEDTSMPSLPQSFSHSKEWIFLKKSAKKIYKGVVCRSIITGLYIACNRKYDILLNKNSGHPRLYFRRYSMCIDVRKKCECSSHTVQFHLRDNVLLPAVIVRVYCPSCPGDSPFDHKSMLSDNEWIIEYDMILAKSLLKEKQQLAMEEVTPEYIFDNGYACWQEMYPGEKEDIREDREKIIKLLEQDRNEYLQAMQNWNIERIKRLKTAGWRKLQQA
jgi:hypothetical protein